MDPATGPHVLRRMNERAVLDVVRRGEPCRLADVVRSTGLSRPAVTRAVAALRAAQWVEVLDEDGVDRSPGRPAQLVRFRAERGHVVGVDAGPHKIVVMLADLSGRVVATRRVDRGDARWIAGDVLDLIVRLTEGVLADHGVAAADLWSIGVGTPGLVDRDTARVLLAPSIPGWAGLSVGDRLRERFGCAVLMDNEANLGALAERWRGVATGVRDLVFVQWGARIGLGIVVAGRVHRGAGSGAGELGFLDLVHPLDAPAPTRPATDDGLGAFERIVGADAIVDLAGGFDSVAEVFAAAAAGDQSAVAALDVVAARFARGIAAALLVLDPELVVIGGGVSGGGEPLLTAVERHLRPWLLTTPGLRLSGLGDTAAVLGAVRYALDDVESRLLPT